MNEYIHIIVIFCKPQMPENVFYFPTKNNQIKLSLNNMSIHRRITLPQKTTPSYHNQQEKQKVQQQQQKSLKGMKICST
jgi:hypothetical protein